MTQKLKWIAKILALIIVLFGLPFYFGYGNPLPFINPDYSFHDNLWPTIFPLMFTGLVLGWKYQKLAGYLVTVPLSIGLIVSSTIKTGFPFHMLVPFFVGILYLFVAYTGY